MKQLFLLSTLFFMIFCVNQPILCFFDGATQFFVSVKKRIIESVITEKLKKIGPGLLTLEEKGKLIRLGALFAFVTSFISVSVNGIIVFRYFLKYKNNENQNNREFIKISCLIALLSFAILGVSFSVFWFGDYLINLPELVREIIIKK